MKLATRLRLFNAAIVAAAVGITAVLALSGLRSALLHQAQESQESRMKTLHELLAQKGQQFQVADGNLMAGTYIINGQFEIPDKVKALCGGTATIFLGDTRVSTNVLTKEGTRAVGTKLQGPAYDAIFKEGKPFRGEANILGTPYFTAYDPIRDAQGKTLGVLYVGVKKSDFMAVINQIQWTTGLSALILVLLAAAGVSWVVQDSLSQLREVAQVLGKAAEGDLSIHVVASGEDEVGHLAHSAEKMLQGMNQAMHDVMATAERVASGSTQLASSADQMNATVHETAKTGEDLRVAGQGVLAALKDLDLNVEAMAGHSQRTQARAEEASRDTDLGARQGQSTAEDMEAIQQATSRIASAIQAIQGIARQTNLLSLNAAIEAAKAGAMGKGFAVVAEEVRILADRSAQSAREIEETIQTMHAAVGEGVDSVHSTLEHLDAIRDRIVQVAASTREISELGTQQASTSHNAARMMDQTAKHLDQNATATHELSATAEEITKTSEELSRVAEGLRETVHRFKLR